MFLLSALLRAVYAIVRLGVRVAGSVEIGRSHRNSAMLRLNPRDEWPKCRHRFDEVDWYQTIPEHQSSDQSGYGVPSQGRRCKVAKPEGQPIDDATGLPTGRPIARSQEPE